jgi:GlpG protein
MLYMCSIGSQETVDYLTSLLAQHQVRFKMQAQGEIVELWVDDRDAQKTAQLLDLVKAPKESPRINPSLLRLAPVTLLFIILGVLGYFIVRFSAPWFYTLTFTQVWLTQHEPWQNIVFSTYAQHYELWRLLTPVFLHFGFVHILVNGLSMWELGRRVEKVLSPAIYLSVLIFMGVLSNAIQYAYTHSAFFGGLSGIVCGLLSFQYVLHQKYSLPSLYMPKASYLITLGLLLAMPLLAKPLFNVNIANAAHFGGLGLGVLLAWVLPTRWIKLPVQTARL